ncbi:MAG: phosphoglycerate mutase family protein [Flavobacteriaceae bacterium]
MQKLILLLSVILFIACAENKSVEISESKSPKKTTIYYLIRHAEKDRTNPDDEDPNLDEDGLKRAENWASIFSEIELDAIYSSDFKRTQQTAKPTAESVNYPVNSYDPHKVYETNFFEITEGLQVLVVGHSNTVPELANFLLKEERYENIPDSVDGRLYIVTKSGENVSSLILNLE